MFLLKIFGAIFKGIWKFFSSKAGKATLAVGGAAGAVAAGVGVGKVASASKKNKQAKQIQEEALKSYNDSLKETERVLARLGEQEKATVKAFEKFLEIVKRINRCPNIREFKTKAKLPKVSIIEINELNNAFEMALNGLGGAGIGGLAGLAFCGLSIGALSFASIGGGVVLCIKGEKLSKQAVNNLKEAKKVSKEIDSIIQYFTQLQTSSVKLEDAFKKANGLYEKKLDKLEKLVDKETDYKKYTNDEKLLVKNCFKLTTLLADMCDTKLAERKGEKELVNEKEVELICEKANVVINESKQGLFEKVFA